MDALLLLIYGIVSFGLILFWLRCRRDIKRLQRNNNGALHSEDLSKGSGESTLGCIFFYMKTGLVYMCLLTFILNVALDRALR